jgi:peptidoglycan hydrolase-like protein with peptidoglycan-binding domain
MSLVILKKGSSGDSVKKLQQNLKTLKFYNGAIDGVFGSKTEEAVIKFQSQNAVKADGVVGDETQAAIERAVWISKRPTLKQGSQGEEVRNLQGLLHGAIEIGQGDFGITSIDGVFGANTLQAVIKFQKSRKLTGDGIVGTATWKEVSFLKSHDMSPEQIILNKIFTSP